MRKKIPRFSLLYEWAFFFLFIESEKRTLCLVLLISWYYQNVLMLCCIVSTLCGDSLTSCKITHENDLQFLFGLFSFFCKAIFADICKVICLFFNFSTILWTPSQYQFPILISSLAWPNTKLSNKVSKLINFKHGIMSHFVR